MKIILDAFGGDYAPAEVIAGGLDALAKRRDLSLIFAGKEAEIEAVLKGRSYDAGRVEILNAPEVISCEEEPTAAIKRKPDSSLDRKSTRLNSSHITRSRMPSSA